MPCECGCGCFVLFFFALLAICANGVWDEGEEHEKARVRGLGSAVAARAQEGPQAGQDALAQLRGHGSPGGVSHAAQPPQHAAPHGPLRPRVLLPEGAHHKLAQSGHICRSAFFFFFFRLAINEGHKALCAVPPSSSSSSSLCEIGDKPVDRLPRSAVFVPKVHGPSAWCRENSLYNTRCYCYCCC